MRAEEILNRGLKLLKSKGEDYTEDRDNNQYENFERSAMIADWFKHDEDKVFAVLIGTKLARIASLLNRDKIPNNESLLDSFIDGANYFALWGGYSVEEKVEVTTSEMETISDLLNKLSNVEIQSLLDYIKRILSDRIYQGSLGNADAFTESVVARRKDA